MLVGWGDADASQHGEGGAQSHSYVAQAKFGTGYLVWMSAPLLRVLHSAVRRTRRPVHACDRLHVPSCRSVVQGPGNANLILGTCPPKLLPPTFELLRTKLPELPHDAKNTRLRGPHTLEQSPIRHEHSRV
jgi:hypothetical protein